MICPYCNNQINDENPFCPKCGQTLVSPSQTDAVKAYWNTTYQEERERCNEYEYWLKKSVDNVRQNRHESMGLIMLLLVVTVGFLFGMNRYYDHQNEMIESMREALVGKTFSTKDSYHDITLSHYYQYWSLTFKDKENLDYAYLETLGPCEDGEKPEYKGTYPYTLSRSMSGKYTITIQNEKYTLEVDENNAPKGISRNEK